MKTAVKISRIVLCVIVSVCTVYLCGHVGYSAYMKGYRITVKGEGGYGMVWEDVVRNAVPAVALLLLGVLCILLLFRHSQGAAIGSAVCAVAGALLGLCSDTLLSEYMFIKYRLGLTTVAVELVPFVKPVLALLCICAAVCYTVFYLIAYRKTYRKEN